MLARCPDCATVFRVAPADLKAARGLVRCGVCFAIFDALEALEDAVPAAATPDPPQDPGPALDPPAPEAPAPEQAPILAQPVADPLDQAGPVTAPALTAHGMLMASERPRPRARAGWVALAVVLTIGLLGQLAWFRGAALIRAYPALQEPLAGLCAYAGCRLPRDPSSVHLVARDVRAHPRYRGALLVNATLVNQAAYDQPYPVLELALYDTEGAVVAGRRFEPREYLEEDAGGLMPTDQPVHVVLELVGPKTPAVSFEFRFL
jgi:predicted Zn finger-like uncharacterized protein